MKDRCPHCKATVKMHGVNPLFFSTDTESYCLVCGQAVEFSPKTGRAVKPRVRK